MCVRGLRSTDRTARRGFTLIELAITLAVVAIILAIAIPNIGAFSGRYRLNHAAHRLEEHLMLARTMAIADNTEYAIQFLEQDEAADVGSWKDNVGKYRLLKGDRPRGSQNWVTAGFGTLNASGVIDLHSGPGDLPGISIEEWSELEGPTYSELPDSLVFGAHGHVTNASADFQDEYVRIVLRNRATNPRAERRAILVDRGGNTLLVMPD
jgi:prepilin-type N-terminal cleavage/methylation domain-containing protein